MQSSSLLQRRLPTQTAEPSLLTRIPHSSSTLFAPRPFPPFLPPRFSLLSSLSFSRSPETAGSDARLSSRFSKQSALVNNVIPSPLFPRPSCSELQLTPVVATRTIIFIARRRRISGAAAASGICSSRRNSFV